MVFCPLCYISNPIATTIGSFPSSQQSFVSHFVWTACIHHRTIKYHAFFLSERERERERGRREERERERERERQRQRQRQRQTERDTERASIQICMVVNSVDRMAHHYNDYSTWLLCLVTPVPPAV